MQSAGRLMPKPARATFAGQLISLKKKAVTFSNSRSMLLAANRPFLRFVISHQPSRALRIAGQSTCGLSDNLALRLRASAAIELGHFRASPSSVPPRATSTLSRRKSTSFPAKLSSEARYRGILCPQNAPIRGISQWSPKMA
jgi:hypothetical protein